MRSPGALPSPYVQIPAGTARPGPGLAGYRLPRHRRATAPPAGAWVDLAHGHHDQGACLGCCPRAGRPPPTWEPGADRTATTPLPDAARHGHPWTAADAGTASSRPCPALVAFPQTWRQIVYHVLLGPPLAFAELLVLAMWGAGIAATTISAWVWIVPLPIRLSHLGSVVFVAYLTVGGLAMLFLAPGLAAAVTRMETRLAPALLAPSRATQLQRRVEALAESRADLVEAADAERRRIERDLHDGTQQRLVSLAVNLGLARATLTDLPDEAREMIDEAHREAKEAIAELNDLVRGLHPAVLEDRGLDAALSGLAARVPYPVRLRVDVDERAAPTVESVAYFVVSEALTNVTKHAHATGVEVTVKRIGKVLQVNVTDNGAGSANPSEGTGLSGLAKRVRSVDGTFQISSPAGGPTTIAVELPCEL